MKILYIYPATVPSMAAPGFQVFRMCQAFRHNGHEVALLCFVNKSSLSYSKEAVFSHYGLDSRFSLFRIPILGICERAKRINADWVLPFILILVFLMVYQPDIVYTRDSFIAYCALKLRCRVIYETPPFPFGEQREWDGKQYEPQLLTFRDHPRFLSLVVLSPLVARAYEDLGVPTSKICIQPSGIDLGRFVQPTTRTEARQALSIPLNDRIVLYAGRLSRLKGTSLILSIAEQMPDVKFLLLGHWAEKDLEELFDRQPHPNIQMVGFVEGNQLPLWLASADVLLCPILSTDLSSQWTSPLKLFEYMASGRPIVASKLPGISAIAPNGQTSILVDNDSVDDYVRAIRSLLDHPDDAQRMGARARTLVSDYTWEQRGQKILAHASENRRHGR